MRRFLFLAVFLAGCGTESAYGQPAWTTGTDASGEAEASTDSATDTGHDIADSRADTATDAAADTPARVCEPGKQEACACVGGSLGAQRCADDGALWEACFCPDAASDSSIDAAADTSADSEADSAMDAPVDTGTDSGSAVDSGADVGQEAGPVTCPGGSFVIVEAPTSDCVIHDGTGRTLHLKTGMTWTAKKWARNAGTPYSSYVNYSDAKAHCAAIGMRLPTAGEVVGLSYAESIKCGFPCGVATWTDSFATTGKHYVVMLEVTQFAAEDTGLWPTMCVKP